MKYILLAALTFSTAALAEETSRSMPPTVGSKRLVQTKPAQLRDCRLVGSVRGAKLWTGDCISIDWKNPVAGSPENPITGSVAVHKEEIE